MKIDRSDRPRLSTVRGVTLGNTLGAVRAAYGPLTFVGTDRWQSRDGLVFYENAGLRIIEIKTGTCGDF